jgi:hypothetical protein
MIRVQCTRQFELIHDIAFFYVLVLFVKNIVLLLYIT